jgi:hypothetical protein
MTALLAHKNAAIWFKKGDGLLTRISPQGIMRRYGTPYFRCLLGHAKGSGFSKSRSINPRE